MKTTGIILLLGLCVSLTVFAQDDCVSIGWANYDGQTYVGVPTGGGNATPTEVTTFAQFKSAVESPDPKVIYIKNSMGNGYDLAVGDLVNIASNKTIIGYPGVSVKCSWQMAGVSNIIIRNVTITNDAPSGAVDYWDCVSISGISKRIWLDHCTIMNGEDDNFDITKGADNISVTWCLFSYAKQGTHNLSNLVGGSDQEAVSEGRLNVTFANCWWKNVTDRTPRTRYGKVHVVNCYMSVVDSGFTSSNGARGGYKTNTRVENCYFENINNPCALMSGTTEGGIFPIGCEFVNCTGTQTGGSAGGYTVFTPPYSYNSSVSASAVKALVTSKYFGAGPTMLSPTQCGSIPAEKIVSLRTGWNIIGCPLTGSTPIDKALSSIWSHVLVVKNLDSFYNKTSTLNSLSKVDWGEGYMVKVDADCTLDWVTK